MEGYESPMLLYPCQTVGSCFSFYVSHGGYLCSPWILGRRFGRTCLVRVNGEGRNVMIMKVGSIDTRDTQRRSGKHDCYVYRTLSLIASTNRQTMYDSR